MLADALAPGAVEHGHRCLAVEQDPHEARIGFEGGHTVTADVVVGADGVHSVVRRAVAGERSPVYSGTVGYRGLVPVESLPALPDSTPLQFRAGPRAHLLHYSRSARFARAADGRCTTTRRSRAGARGASS